MGTITADDLERSYSNGLKKGREEVDALNLQIDEQRRDKERIRKEREKAETDFCAAVERAEVAERIYSELKAAIWKHLHIKHERTICPLSVGTPERCCEIIMRDAGLNPADGQPIEKRNREGDGHVCVATDFAPCPSCGRGVT